ncbi:hypothetical protein [Burkholderia cenocepacia]|uniref:CYTH domain-containing protein n=1 Tax=Burkholderia cenocepacia TaxID=95486 RepID=UPI000761D05B|nr:hypothetical protein [Burkholderia cenocepacia]KWU19098.1 hypothetical protein AS149_12690 [Burkholderia cenocepacia]
MAKENERKFLVADASVLSGLTGSQLRQRYLEESPVEVRVQRSEDSAQLLVTSPDNAGGFVVHEVSIGLEDADELIARYAPGGLVDKSLVVIRVRIEDGAGMFAIKGPTQDNSRDEYEQPVELEVAEHWMQIDAGTVIDKTRYRIPVEEYVFEVDVFGGRLHPLLLAEVEFEGDGKGVPLPAWLGQEVSDDPRYYNSNLTKATEPPVPRARSV